ncbi:MAG: flagellar protein FlgN [Lachnospiraceae bacterium]|nr:flagellar protein FlgN [Lachnospiraceae bacterium]
MENLLDVLEQEDAVYSQLLQLSMKKTPIIIKGDITSLETITDEEQNVVDRINYLEKQREEVMKDIANVLNKDVTTLKLVHLVEMLKSQPKEQARLSAINDKLKNTTGQMRRVNEQNKELLTNALEMVEFDLNLLKGLRAAPETANYNQAATNTGDYYNGSVSGSFDAKQ